MTLEELHEELSYVTASRENRLKYANMVLNDMSLFPKLIDVLFMVDDKVSCHAAWVFEFVCKDYIYAIIPHLDKFTSNLHRLRFDSSIRAVAKICELIAKENYSKENLTIKKFLTAKHKEQIIENSFDWMINKRAIAVKVHAMSTLFFLGRDNDWVHPELKQILERDFQIQSSGFKARARHILKKLKAA